MGALDGKVAIVSGAGQGVGRCHAQLLAAEGAAVVVNDLGDAAHEAVEVITGAGGSAVAHLGNVADWDGCGAMVKTALEQFGGLDVIVNNAGITRDAMSFSMTEEQYDLVLDVHLKGHVALAHAAGAYWRAMAKQLADDEAPRHRSIINTTSESGLFGGPAQANYGSAKGGIITLTRILAKELGKYGVNVNCIAPRARTPMTANQPMFAPAADPSRFDPYDPAHVSPMVGWLASDAAADVSGQTFIVTGDEIHLMQQPAVQASVFGGDQRWTLDAITARKDELFADMSPTMPMWGGPAMRRMDQV